MEGTKEFDDGLKGFFEDFHRKVEAVKNYTKKAKEVCSEALAPSNVRHLPITSRIKSWDSAKGSLCRRYQEYLVYKELRDLVEAPGRKWSDYCLETGLTSDYNKTLPLHNSENMFGALHDFGGMRISLYFPGDLEKVAAIINKHFRVIRRTDKGDGTRITLQSLKDRLESLKNPQKTSLRDFNQTTRTFTGYKATHFVVKLLDKDIEEGSKYSWNDVVVEIQVGTLIMHIWSEIEHDMIYKPIVSQGGGVSDDEERILDLINGIVLTGEAALRQLEASTTKRLNQRAEIKEMMAGSHYEVATWIERDCKELGISLRGGEEWVLLEQLFTILRTTRFHRHADVTELIEKTAQQTPSRQELPMMMLKALCRNQRLSRWLPLNKNNRAAIVQNARLWALRLVHSLNLATYLGVAQSFVKVKISATAPSFTSFLDILHPHQPRYSGLESAMMISEFCQAIIEYNLNCSDKLVETAIALTDINLTTSLVGSENLSIVPVPIIFSQLLPPGNVDDCETEGDIHFMLEAIGYIMARFQKNTDKPFSLARLMGGGEDFKYHCLIPMSMHEEMPRSRWRFSQESFSLILQTADPEEYHESAMPQVYSSSWPTESKLSGGKDHSDFFLNLAYHLYPKDQWEDVYRAWKMVDPLRSNWKRQTASNLKNKELFTLLGFEGLFAEDPSRKASPKHSTNQDGVVGTVEGNNSRGAAKSLLNLYHRDSQPAGTGTRNGSSSWTNPEADQENFRPRTTSRLRFT